MVLVFKKIFYLLIFLSTGIVHPIHGQESNDDTCHGKGEVFCVRDVLLEIATVARRVNRTANEIEKHILNKVEIVGSLNRYIRFEIDNIGSHLPLSPLHINIFKKNNISKKDLTYLVLEAHYALSFYFNSISEILNMNDAFSAAIDSWFKQIQVNLKNNMICRYRSVLDVYSHAFPTITQVKQIPFSERKYPNKSSLVHNVRSIVVVRLLREWMQKINSAIVALEKKFV